MHQFKKLLHRFHINEARLGNALKVLKKLTLFPSSHYFSLSEKNLQIIQPDVFLEKHQNVFFVFLNENERHQVKLNSYYLALLKSKTLPAVRSYIQEKIRLALCIKKALLFRKKTLLRVVEAIVDWQKNWFKAKGPLRPLTLREIADVIGAHESTVSRATNGKYLQTDQGVFELKYFFSSTLLTTEGEEISGEAIRGMIQMIVEQENFNEPLSDSTIQKKLLEKRIQIARRTVARYRKSLKIPSCQKRRGYHLNTLYF